MTKQEKIREGIAKQVWCCSINLEMARRGEPIRYLPAEFDEQHVIDKQPYYEAADLILEEESSQGVVIKVERGLPYCKRCCSGEYLGDSTQQDMLNAGYVAVENLIDD